MNLKEIQTMIRNFEKSDLTFLELETSDFKLRLSKNKQDFQEETIIKNEVSETEVKETKNCAEVKSPLVGTFYSSSGPNNPNFVEVGQKVVEGQTLCIIEAMKIMNEISSPVSGTIKEIKVKDGMAVGFDEVLMTIE